MGGGTLYVLQGLEQRLELTVEDGLHTVESHFEHDQPGSRFDSRLSLGAVMKMVERHLLQRIGYHDNQALVHLHLPEIIGEEGVASADELRAAGVLSKTDVTLLAAVQKEIFQRNLYDTPDSRLAFVTSFNQRQATGVFRLGLRSGSIVNLFTAPPSPTNELTLMIGRWRKNSDDGRIRTMYPGRPLLRLPADPPVSYLDSEDPTDELRRIYECWKNVGFLVPSDRLQ